MITKPIAVLLAPLLLNGCMMAGMAGMGHMGTGMNAASARSEPTVIKEVSGGGFRVTVDFPYYASVDSLSYTVTVRGADGQLIGSDALVALEVSPAATDSAVTAMAPSHAGHAAQGEHAIPGGLLQMRFAPVERGGGRFVFRPSLAPGAAYRLVVVVGRVGDEALEPPIVVEHRVVLPAPTTMSGNTAHLMPSGGVTPLLVLGGVAMAVMMLFAMR